MILGKRTLESLSLDNTIHDKEIKKSQYKMKQSIL